MGFSDELFMFIKDDDVQTFFNLKNHLQQSKVKLIIIIIFSTHTHQFHTPV